MIALRTLLLLSLLVGCRAQQTCLQTNMELRDAVADYVASGGSPDSASAMTYGHPIGTWCVGELDDFSFAFAFQDFNEPLDGWDVSNATSLDYMFFNSITFNQDISGWTVERVETMKGMFDSAESFNQDLSAWRPESCREASFFLNMATSYSISLCSWGSIFQPGTTVAAMFTGTACPEQSDPDLNANPPGPFCEVCLPGPPTALPTRQPTMFPTEIPIRALTPPPSAAVSGTLPPTLAAETAPPTPTSATPSPTTDQPSLVPSVAPSSLPSAQPSLLSGPPSTGTGTPVPSSSTRPPTALPTGSAGNPTLPPTLLVDTAVPSPAPVPSAATPQPTSGPTPVPGVDTMGPATPQPSSQPVFGVVLTAPPSAPPTPGVIPPSPRPTPSPTSRPTARPTRERVTREPTSAPAPSFGDDERQCVARVADRCYCAFFFRGSTCVNDVYRTECNRPADREERKAFLKDVRQLYRYFCRSRRLKQEPD